MTLPKWKEIIFSKDGPTYALYKAVKKELANIPAGIPADNSITRAKLIDAIINFSALDSNTKRFTIQIPIIADAAADSNWVKSIYIPIAAKVIDTGIIPSTQFGQATDFAVIGLVNKGTDGTGTTPIASKNFNSSNVAAAHDYTSLGTVDTDHDDIDAGSVLEFVRSKTGNGQIVPASTLVLVLERAA